jgi:chlorobactene glucosyltransferase
MSWASHQASLLVFVTVLLLIALSNLRALRRLGDWPLPRVFPPVSILVPVRNEAQNVEPCLRSLLAQEYGDFEILVLDDESTDGTGEILAALSSEDLRLRVPQGKPLPQGWLGKHWACFQLAQIAAGELLLFTDADTRHHPQALGDAVAALVAERCDLLSALPREIVISWAERLAVPIIPWSILSFLPLGLAHRLRVPALTAAVGQFVLCGREAYVEVCGHAALRDHTADDLALVRLMAARGFVWRLVDGSSRVSCRMYQDTHQVLEGFSKNLFAAFDYRIVPFVFVWLWLGLVFCEPPVVLLLITIAPSWAGLSPLLAAAAIAVSLLLWGITCRRCSLPLYLALLYPATVLVTVAIALRSMSQTLAGRARWKGRRLPAPRVRWV